MQTLTNLKLSVKSALFFLLIGILSVSSYSVVNHFLNVQKDDAAIVDAAGRNRMFAQRIAYYAERLVKDGSTKGELAETVSLLNASVNALKMGGVAPGIAKDRILPPTPAHIMPSLIEAEHSWLKYKMNAEALLEISTAIRSSAKSDSASQMQLKHKIEEATESLIYIEEHSDLMVQKFSALVALYVHQAEEKQARLQTIILSILLVTIFILIACWFALQRYISQPLLSISEATHNVSEGNTNVNIAYEANDEIGAVAKNTRRLIANLDSAALFAKSIADGRFISDYTPAGENDNLGKALIHMRDKLQQVATDDKKRNWGTEGLAKFSEILRTHQNDLSKVSQNVLVSLIKYLDANQGALFIVNDDSASDVHLELVSTYAWNRNRHRRGRIEKGEGVAGQVWLEKEFVYMKHVPEDFVEITSGIGKANPRSVLVAPLKLNDEVFGIIEIASFREYADFEIEFVLKISETIASTLSTAKVNQRTSRLLTESQQQAEELRAQEEEMRQNMEELQATQEEMQRKTTETESRLLAVDQSGVASIEFNLDGTIVYANHNFLDLMEYTRFEIEGKHHRIFVDPLYAASEEYRKFWEDLSNGIPRPGQYERFTKSGKRITIQGSYSIIRDGAGKPYRILKLATDVSSIFNAQQGLKQKTMEAESRLRAIEESGIASIEFDLDGTIVAANNNFLRLMEYSFDEIKGKHHKIFVDRAYGLTREYADFWKDLSAGIPRPGKYVRITKSGRKVKIQGSYSILKDNQGVPYRILKMATAITDNVTIELPVS